jgi:RHS repeat-associated protein
MYGVDGEGRASTANQGSQTLIGNVTFNASSKPLVINIGTSGDNDAYTYDPATGRMGTYTFSVNGHTDAGTLTWNPNGTLGQLAVVDGFNVGGTQTCAFGYDDVMRLVSDNCGSTHWSQTFSYDQYDNLTKTGNPGITWNPGYYPANNRYSTIGATYDSDGRLTYDTFNTYTWDTYGKMSSVRSGNNAAVCGISGTCVVYDASGRAVEKNVSGAYSEILYSPMGETAIMSGASTVSQSYIPLPGGMSMTATGAGGTGQRQMEHHDWLGTARLSTLLSNGSVVYDRAFAPYGENYDNVGSTSSLNFTGDRQDIIAGLFDTPNREQMPNQGRWISPDPAGQGWNLYAYPTDPNRFVDPSGLQTYQYGSSTMHGCTFWSTGACADLNGMWGEAGSDNWNDTLGQKLQQYARLNQDPIQQIMDRINGVVSAVFRPALQSLNWGLLHWDIFQGFVDNGMADTSVRVGWFKNTVLNPYGHIALGVGDNPLSGLNPASDAQFIAYWALYTDGCVGGLACNPLAMTVVPGVILPEDPNKASVKEMMYFVGAERGIAIQTAIGLSKDNPPNYSVQGPLPACDCGSWAQQMLGFGGIASGPPTWKPETLMQQLEQF